MKAIKNEKLKKIWDATMFVEEKGVCIAACQQYGDHIVIFMGKKAFLLIDDDEMSYTKSSILKTIKYLFKNDVTADDLNDYVGICNEVEIADCITYYGLEDDQEDIATRLEELIDVFWTETYTKVDGTPVE